MMNATQLFMGLIAVFVGLYVIALLKPHVFKNRTVSIDDFKSELLRRLPDHDLMIKQGSQSRIIISQDGTQKAIVIMDKPKEPYVMGGLPIFTTNKLSELGMIADRIGGLGVVIN